MRFSKLTQSFYPEDLDYKNLPNDLVDCTIAEHELAMSRITNETLDFVDGMLIIIPAPIIQPTPQELISAIDAAIEQHTEDVAQAKNYKSGDRCVSYTGYVNPFQDEALAYATWRTNCWVYVIQEQNKVIAGTRTIPTPEEAVLELPAMVWPV